MWKEFVFLQEAHQHHISTSYRTFVLPIHLLDTYLMVKRLDASLHTLGGMWGEKARRLLDTLWIEI